MADLHTILSQAGFRGQALRNAEAIAMAESGGNPRAHNPNAATGDNSYGLFQINMLGGMGPERRQRYGLHSNDDLYDPVTNARVAFALSNGGRDFSPWSTYKSGAYQKYLGTSSRPMPQQEVNLVRIPGYKYQVAAPVLPAVESIIQQFGVRPSSGYRSAQHNAEVGGATHSDHLTGGAVDFVGSPSQMQALYRWAVKQNFPYVEPLGQAKNHVHISFFRGDAPSAGPVNMTQGGGGQGAASGGFSSFLPPGAALALLLGDSKPPPEVSVKMPQAPASDGFAGDAYRSAFLSMLRR